MVHNAFDSRLILRDCPARIDSVGLWGAQLLIGCIDGSLRIFASEEKVDVLPSDSEITVPTYTLRETRIGFAKKAVTSMDVLQSRGLLVTLSDAVAIHTLPEFEVVSYLTKTKGAAMYCWDEDRGLLAVAKLKRILVYRYDGSRGFTETKDLPAPDTVNAMAWCSGALCLGIRKEYIIMNINTGITVEIFSSGRSASPVIVSLPDGNLLLGKDKIGVIVDHNGKPTEDGGLSWNEMPAGVVVHLPYALARLSRHIEVRSLKPPHGLVQMLPLNHIHLLLSSDAGLIAATETAIHRILPVPIPVQVVQLAASGNFVDALSLCRMLPPEDAPLRASKEDAIHIRYGHYLFEQGEYAEALEHFGASSLDLTTILSLFPSIKLPSIVSPVSSDGHHIGTPTERTQAGLSSDQDASGGQSSPQENIKQQDGQQRKIALSALAGFLSSRRRDVIEKAEAEETDAAVAAMVEASPLTRRNSEKSTETTSEKRLHEARELAIVLDTALVQALLATNQSQAALKLLKGPNYCDIVPCEEMMSATGHYLELIELYKSHEMHHQALRLLNDLAEKPESFPVPPRETQEVRSQYVLDYLKNIGSQDPSLVLESSNWILKNNVKETMVMFAAYNPPLPINQVLAYLKKNFPELRVLYLEHMLGKHADAAPAELQNELLQLYLARVLEERDASVAQGKWDERDHSEAREKLLKVLQNTTAYSPDRILQRLPIDGLYEERAYLLGRLGQHRLALTLYAHKLHEADLALAYCDRVYATAMMGRKIGKPSSKTILPPVDPGAMTIYLTLLEVYLKPKAAVREYDRSLMSLAPAKAFAGARPSPHQQQKTRAGVARKIAEIEGAEESKFSFSSAESAAESSRSDSEDLVEGPTMSSEDLMLDDALGLLSRRWDRLDGAQALRMIPSDTKLNNLLPFLEPLLRTSSESRRNSAVIKSLHRSENLQVREGLLQCRKQVVKVNSDRTCSICRKKIGTSVFAVYPSGTLAHFVCYRDSHVSRPAVGPGSAGF